MNPHLGQTPSQTVGPYFAYGLVPTQYGYAFESLFDECIAGPNAAGQPIRLSGQVLDGAGEPISDALIEAIQCDAEGRFPSDPAELRQGGFRGFGRSGTGTRPDHRFAFQTIKPGTTAEGGAPHLALIVMMRGLLSHAYTRVYFEDEPAANATDPVLAQVPAARRHTLMARREPQPDGSLAYRFDIHLQGSEETVFFDV